ncbi:MAG: ATP-dependent DNA helicase RecQ [Acidimicrobiales bacterium]|nr:ATP-dependent DNA helicase RecQ [Acidimicrobiales bacterium]
MRAHITALAGSGAEPRPEQVDAVSAVVAGRRRTLLVARTGFGKSAVYFSATRMLRDRGWGPTLVVSPLLALMRDQVAAAGTLGLNAQTINSSNLDSWREIEEAIARDEVDLLLISPERLANAGFRERVFASLLGQPFALVCDEAHCISDWGHDFRPDYLRLRHLINDLPAWTPVLATTATANQRVTDDVATQLGSDTLVLRTSLDRASLHLSSVDLPSDAERLAWLAGRMPELDGSGIVYCLTQNQAEQTATWLRSQGVAAQAYTGATDGDARLHLEDQLRSNELKALVATSALGMGFDKGDMAFCIHLGLPPTPVAYYQQIGRAGRAIDRAEVIAVPRPAEDAAVWRWFEQVSLPPEQTCHEVLTQLSPGSPTSIAILETNVNLGRNRLSTLLKILEVDGAVAHVKGGFIIADQQWAYDRDKAERLRALRRTESEQMLAFRDLRTCRLRFLREALDDAEAGDCGRCDNCLGLDTAPPPLDPLLVAAASELLRGGDAIIEPRKLWPSGLDEPKGKIGPDLRAEAGRALCRLGDGGWDPVVTELFADPSQPLPDDLVRSIAGILKRWDWPARPTWICPIPSRRRAPLINAAADALGQLGKLPVHRALHRVAEGGWQSEQANSAHQVANVWGRIAADTGGLPDADVLAGPVLLLDDEADSRWTLTVCAAILRTAGSGPVLPFVLRAR